jgi:hypothetical protein
MNGSLFKIGLFAIIVILLFTSFFTLYSFNDSNDEFYCDLLLESAVLGGDYIVNATNADGSFVYEYNASSGKESSSYNILRHAGTVYFMLELYNVTKDERLLSSAEKSIVYLLSFVKPFDNSSVCIVYNDEVKLGGNALAVVALAEHMKVTGEDVYLPIMQNLTCFIKLSQNESGGFICKQEYSTGYIYDWDSEYYTGEALLALCRLYQLDHNETWLDVAEKGAKYLINVRDKNVAVDNLIHDHWLLMALNELYRYRIDSLYFDHSMNISEGIMLLQRDGVNRKSEYPEWLGSYYTPPSSASTATRSEGLIAAYHLSFDFGEKNMTERILRSIKLGVDFQLKTQITTENNVGLHDLSRALGGFHESLTDYDIRIDYVQHNVCSILGLYHILKSSI